LQMRKTARPVVWEGVPGGSTFAKPEGRKMCAGHVQQFGGGSPPPNLMEVKG
jgi:hypothetical protein